MSFPKKPPSWLWAPLIAPLGLIAGWWLAGLQPEARMQLEAVTPRFRDMAGMRFSQVPERPIWIAVHETSHRDYARQMGGEGNELPAPLSFQAAQAYAEALSHHHEGTFRLPHPEEWEDGARGGLRGQPFPWGNKPAADQASFDAVGPRPVQDGRPNRLGLVHAAGNVYEWCQDGSARGGAWSERDARMLQLDRVASFPAGYEDADVGLRLVWEP